jgi:hypothetical protein
LAEWVARVDEEERKKERKEKGGMTEFKPTEHTFLYVLGRGQTHLL